MDGICIAALGYEIYGSFAISLAISIKVSDKSCKIALLCDEQSIKHLTSEELEIFDYLIKVEEDYKEVGYQIIKLMVYKYTPFERTIYLDADSIWLDKKISWLIGEMSNKDFYIGLAGNYLVKNDQRPKNDYTFWGVPKTICEYHKIKEVLPQTVSGFFYFKKSEFATKVFKLALDVYHDEKTPDVKWANGKADEYCFNVALGLLNYTQDKFDVFYFDKLHKEYDPEIVYNSYWGIAVGGNKISYKLKTIYDKLVEFNANKLGILPKRYAENKKDIIPERNQN